ncbi:MAG: hypothetical protein HYX34_02480 [Actinobacteria bacterium]|nr:hypothetical protein [Actinomycetota bacterium]
MIRAVSVVVVLALATVACGSSGDSAEPRNPTTTMSPSSTTTTDPWAVPEKIDVAYVQRVVDEFSRILTQAWVRARDKGTVDAEVERLIRSVESEGRVEFDLSSMRQAAEDDFRRVVTPIVAERAQIKQIVYASPSCIQASGVVDYSRSIRGGTPQGVVFEFERAVEERLPNRTGWQQYGLYQARAPEGGKPCARP